MHKSPNEFGRDIRVLRNLHTSIGLFIAEIESSGQENLSEDQRRALENSLIAMQEVRKRFAENFEMPE